jgi:hypothetical protein
MQSIEELNKVYHRFEKEYGKIDMIHMLLKIDPNYLKNISNKNEYTQMISSLSNEKDLPEDLQDRRTIYLYESKKFLEK